MNSYYKNNQSNYEDIDNYKDNEESIIEEKDDFKIDDTDNNDFKHFSGNYDNREYLSLISKGVIWLFMFLLSLFSLFMIFKTPYYIYYNQTNPLIVKQAYNDLSDVIYKPKISGYKYNDFQTEGEKKIVQDVISKEISSGINEGIKQNQEKTNTPQQKSQKIISDKQQSSTIQKIKSESDMTNLLKQNTNKVSNSSSEANLTVVNKPKKDDLLNTKNYIKPFTKEEVVPNVWIVNIFSSSKKDSLYKKLEKLQLDNNNILNDKLSYYFTVNVINGSYIYRIALANKDTGYFSSSVSAKNFCNSIKESSDIDCFISAINKKDLELYRIR